MTDHLKLYQAIVRRGFYIAFVLFVTIVATVFYTIYAFKDFSSWAEHAHDVLRVVDNIETLAERAESGQRSYLLSRSPIVLKTYSQASNDLGPELKKLVQLVVDNPAQSERAIHLQKLIQDRIEKMDDTLQKSIALTPTEAGKLIDLNATRDLQMVAQELEDAEDTLLNVRRAEAHSFLDISLELILLACVSTFVMVFINRRLLSSQAAIHASQSLLLNSVFENLGCGLMVVDIVGQVTKFNPSAEQLIGISPKNSTAGDRIKAGRFMHLDSGKDVTPDETAIARALKGEIVSHFEVYSNFPDRERIILDVNARPIVASDGRITGALSIFDDITQRKNLENEWKLARETALESSRLKSDFLASMSHEIRTPMNGVIGMTTLLAGTALDSEQKLFVRTIKSSAESLITLINQLLDHSKIEAGKLELNIDDFNLAENLEGVMNMFRYSIQSKTVKFELIQEKGLPEFVRGDAARLRQILVNLIGNAFKFTERGYVRLSVSAMPSANNNSHKILFEIKDTGAGIAKSKQTRLFEKFSQVHSTNFIKYGGTGLGLTISKELTHLMNGEIGVESQEGFGSKFWFHIEFARAEKSVQPVAAGGFERTKFKGRVLVAEDQPVNRLVIEKYLRLFDVDCKIAKNGVEAVEFFKQEKFDLIFMDCQMPELDGYQATLQIRAIEKQSGGHTPIVALTAEGRSGDRTRCVEVGMDGFLAKPIEIELLANVLRERLTRAVDLPVRRYGT